jgi:hypothetical protein
MLIADLDAEHLWMCNRPCADATREATSWTLPSNETRLWLLYLGGRHSRKQQWLARGHAASGTFAARVGNSGRRDRLAIFHSDRHGVYSVGRQPRPKHKRETKHRTSGCTGSPINPAPGDPFRSRANDCDT